MHYEVEINVGRRNSPPVWLAMTEPAGDKAEWVDASHALKDMADDGRKDFRVVRVEDDGTRNPLHTTFY